MIIDEFISHLEDGPRVLFLGQNYLRLELDNDSFLSQIIAKYVPNKTAISGYSDFLDAGLGKNPEEVVAWMEARSSFIPIPKPLETIAGYSWSSVFTTAFDDVQERAFRTNWRPIQQIFSDSFMPSDPRSHHKLHIWHLYGGVSSPDSLGYPPLTKEQLWSRHGVAGVLASKIPELVSPVGTFVIEGYTPTDDWFSSERIYSVISRLLPRQCYLFSAPSSLKDDQYLQSLIRQNKLIIFKESLAQVLHDAWESASILLYEPTEEIEYRRQIRINGKKKGVPPGNWLQLTETSHVLTEADFLPLEPQNQDKRYSDFKRFLYDASICPPWTGYARGFAFRRSFENDLRVVVSKKLEKASARGTATILRGQTGTGKTIALGHLAYDIQKEGRFPVIFIDRSIRINREYIDRFCEWCEQQGAPATLVIWDGMQTINEYDELLQYFKSRGRNVALVGSSYVTQQDQIIDFDKVDAPASLTPKEANEFTEFLNQVDPNLGGYISQRIEPTSVSFLGFLYRLLPDSRPGIRRGVQEELTFAEGILTAKAADVTVTKEVRTVLGEALFKAGLISKAPLLDTAPRNVAGESISELQELIGLVMVPGQYSIPCPFDLLLRTLNKDHTEHFMTILKSVDIFRWSPPEADDITVEPRTSLEAQLIVQIRLGGPAYEVQYAIKMLKAVRLAQMFQQSEINFAVDLIHSLGPNGSKPGYYQRHFTALADCLRTMRESGVELPRLLLQESLLCRESAKLPENSQNMIELLKQSEFVSNKILEIVKEEPSNRYFLSRAHVELASCYGLFATREKDQSRSLVLLNRAHIECYKAHSLDPQNFYPIDVISWTTRDLLESPDISDDFRVSLQADVMHAFDLADTEGYQGEAFIRLNSRKEEIFTVLGKFDLSQNAFDALIEQGSCLGIFARASRMARFIYTQQEFTDEQRVVAKQAYDYLVSYEDRIKSDSKCQLLRFRLWWTWKTGKPLATGERSTIALSEEDWRYVRLLTSALLDNEEMKNNLRILYYEALATFQIGEYGAAIKLFRQLDYQSQSYGGRILKQHLWTNSSGQPIRTNGTVDWIDEKGRGEIFVSRLQTRITFLKHDTGEPEITRGMAFNNFKVAFGFRGPIADFRE